MTEFRVAVHQNQFLAIGADRVDALVRVTASGSDAPVDAPVDALPPPPRSVILIVDVSGSMDAPRSKFEAAMAATSAAVDCIEDGVSFGIIAGNHEAIPVFPKEGGLAVASERSRSKARRALRHLRPEGGTAIGSWLRRAADMFEAVDAIHHVILMTDGQNQSETPEQFAAALEACVGRFRCDCRGVGEDWKVDELRQVSSALLGSLDIVPDPSDTDALTSDFVGMMRSAMDKSVPDADLRFWTPRDARVEFVKQVRPSIEDLTGRRVAVSELVGGYPTGAWGDETRDYLVRVQVPARPVGDEMLAGRVHIVVGDVVVSEAKVVAIWTDDLARSTEIDREVARAVGNSELADQIQEGVRAWAAGDDVIATDRIGRAVQLAHEADDTARLEQLADLVDIHDAATGTVVLRPGATRLAAMTLDAQSAKTVVTGTAVGARPGG